MTLRARAAVLLTAGLTSVVLTGPAGPPAAADARALAAACPADRIGEPPFTDLGGTVHREAIACAAHWEVARGTSRTTYSPTATVDRGQAASFVVRLLDAVGAVLPEPSGDSFDDDDGSVHEASIERLAAAGVVQGRSERRYGTAERVTRAQAAALLVRAFDLRAQQDERPGLPPGPDAFRDDDGEVLEPQIDRAAAAGLVAGRTADTFVPGGPVARDAMASFLARTLDLAVSEGMAEVPPAPVVSRSVVAVGDIACAPGTPARELSCKHGETAATAAALDPDAVLLLGDIQYEDGSVAEFQGPGGWNGTWSQFLDRTWPAPGNHEWHTEGAAGYRSVFDARTGGSFWYSRDLDGWHVVSLDSDCVQVGGCRAGSPQHDWFVQDLAAHDGKPTLVFWHHQRWATGSLADNPAVSDLWSTAVADPDVQLVLMGHSHAYERFGPLDAAGSPSPGGLPSFVVGTGGRSLGCTQSGPRRGELFSCSSYGVLHLDLRQDGFDYEFVPSTGTFTDKGSRPLRPR